MRKIIALIAASLALIAGSCWAIISGANYELSGFSPPERMHVLDTTMIGEKWMLLGGGMAALAVAFLALAGALYYRARRKTFA